MKIRLMRAICIKADSTDSFSHSEKWTNENSLQDATLTWTEKNPDDLLHYYVVRVGEGCDCCADSSSNTVNLFITIFIPWNYLDKTRLT